MEEKPVNLGVRNNNGKGGQSSYPSLSMVLVLTVIAVRLGLASESRVLGSWQHVSVCVVSGRPNCVAAHVAVLVTVTNVLHHAMI